MYEDEMPDLIDIRDRKANVKSSVIKRWNVHFVTQEELDAKKAAMEAEEAKAQEIDLDAIAAEEEELRRAQEVFERLEREAAADRAKELEEQRLAYQMANGELPDDMYNSTTGSYSGAYGRRPIDDETKAQLDEIMNNNGNDISALFAQAEQEAMGGSQIDETTVDEAVAAAAELEQSLFDEENNNV